MNFLRSGIVSFILVCQVPNIAPDTFSYVHEMPELQKLLNKEQNDSGRLFIYLFIYMELVSVFF